MNTTNYIKRNSCICFLLFIVIITKAQQNYFTIDTLTTPVSCGLGTAKITISGGQSPYNVNWNNGFHGSYQTGLEAGFYLASIVDAAGRDTSITIEIKAKKCRVIINNSFSPNGDDIDDYLSISNTNQYPNFTFKVFDRWGQLVHQQKNTFEPWDGKQLGVNLPIGTYFYIFFYD
jgi:gliding motility-associated-like protein